MSDTNQENSLDQLDYLKYLQNTKLIIFVAIVVRIIVAFRIGQLHADEFFQGTEIAYNLIYPEREFLIIPWEFETSTRNYLWPIILYPIVYLALLINLEGFAIFHSIRMIIGLISVYPIIRIDQIYTDKISGAIAQWILAIYFPLVLFNLYLTSDSFAIILMLILLPMIKKSDSGSTETNNYIIGVFIGLIISLRHQYVLFWIPYLLTQFRKGKFRISGGLVIGLLPWLILDWLFYGIPFITAWNFLTFNVIFQENIIYFGSRPFWYYLFYGSISFLGGIGILILVFLFKDAKGQIDHTMLPILHGVLLYIIIFQFLSYKEVRFLAPVAFLLILLSLYGVPKFQVRYKKTIWKVIILLIILFTLISSIIAPVHIFGNVWRAQDYARNYNPSANVAIHAGFWETGGYLFQCGDNPDCGELYFLYQKTEIEVNEIFKKVDIIILNSRKENYFQYLRILQDSCIDSELLAEFKEISPLSLHGITKDMGYNIIPTYDMEVWKCTLG